MFELVVSCGDPRATGTAERLLQTSAGGAGGDDEFLEWVKGLKLGVREEQETKIAALLSADAESISDLEFLKEDDIVLNIAYSDVKMATRRKLWVAIKTKLQPNSSESCSTSTRTAAGAGVGGIIFGGCGGDHQQQQQCDSEVCELWTRKWTQRRIDGGVRVAPFDPAGMK